MNDALHGVALLLLLAMPKTHFLVSWDTHPFALHDQSHPSLCTLNPRCICSKANLLHCKMALKRVL
jgi:hypothetical protein